MSLQSSSSGTATSSKRKAPVAAERSSKRARRCSIDSDDSLRDFIVSDSEFDSDTDDTDDESTLSSSTRSSSPSGSIHTSDGEDYSDSESESESEEGGFADDFELEDYSDESGDEGDFEDSDTCSEFSDHTGYESDSDDGTEELVDEKDAEFTAGPIPSSRSSSTSETSTSGSSETTEASSTSAASGTSSNSSVTFVSIAPVTSPSNSAINLIRAHNITVGTTPVAADGNCGYRALGTALLDQGFDLHFTVRSTRSTTLPQKLRNELVKWITDKQSHYFDPRFKHHYASSNDTLQQVIRRIKGPADPVNSSCWFSTPLDCQLFADRFQCIVLIAPIQNASYLQLYHPTTRGNLDLFPSRNITTDEAILDPSFPVAAALFNTGHATRLDFSNPNGIHFRALLSNGRSPSYDSNGSQTRGGFVRVFNWL